MQTADIEIGRPEMDARTYHCGAAVALRMLDAAGAWEARERPTLDDVYELIQSHKTNDDFFADPEGLVGCLRTLGPARYHWLLYASESPDEITGRLAVALAGVGLPTAALVSGGYHWALVTSMYMRPLPGASIDSGGAFRIRVENPGRRGSVEDVDYDRWCLEYLTPNTVGGIYAGKRVCVVGTRRAGVIPRARPRPRRLSSADAPS